MTKRPSLIMYIIFGLLVLGLLFFGPESAMQFSGSSNALISTQHREVDARDISSLSRQLLNQYPSQKHANMAAIQALRARLAVLSVADILKLQPSQTKIFKTLVSDGYKDLTPEQQALHFKAVDQQHTAALVNDIFFNTQPKSAKMADIINSPLNNNFLVSYVSIDPSHSDMKISIKDSDISKHYDTYKHRFKTPDQYTIDYILVRQKDLPIPTISDEQIAREFNKNENFYAQQAAEIYLVSTNTDGNSVQSPTDLAKRAIDTIRHQLGKNTQFTEKKALRSQVNPVILRELDQKHVSTPHHTGKHTEFYYTHTPKKLTLASVKNDVISHLQNNMQHEQFTKLKHQLGEDAFTHPDKLPRTTLAQGISHHTTKPLSVNNPPKPFTTASLESLHTDDVSKNHFNSPVIELDDQTFVIYRINTHHPARQMTISEAKPQITDKLRREQISMKIREAKKFTNLSKVSKHLSIKPVERVISLDEKNNELTSLLIECVGEDLCVRSDGNNTLFASILPGTKRKQTLELNTQLLDNQYSTLIMDHADIQMSPSITYFLQGEKA